MNRHRGDYLLLFLALTWQLKVADPPGYTVTLSMQPSENPGGELTQVL